MLERSPCPPSGTEKIASWIFIMICLFRPDGGVKPGKGVWSGAEPDKGTDSARLDPTRGWWSPVARSYAKLRGWSTSSRSNVGLVIGC